MSQDLRVLDFQEKGHSRMVIPTLSFSIKTLQGMVLPWRKAVYKIPLSIAAHRQPMAYVLRVCF